jgi:YVTN family beta-propeller protein
VAARIPVGLLPLDVVRSSDGRTVYVTNSGERSVSVIGVDQLAEVARLPAPVVGEGPFGIAVSTDGSAVYVTDSDAGQVLAIDAASGRLLRRIPVVASPRSLSLSPDGRRLYVSGFDGGISEIDTRTHEVTRTLATAPAGGVFRLAVAPDGRRLYGTDWVNASLLVLDLDLGILTDIIPTLPDARNTRDLVLSDDGSTLYAANQDTNELLVFETESLAGRQVLQVSDGPRGIAYRNKPPGAGPSLEPVSRFDFDGNGRVDFSDFLLFAKAFGARMGDGVFDARYDVNNNNRIDFDDFLAFASDFGKTSQVLPPG